ncbi:hypothetical protein [Campylobacter hyointestinalis]|uniref:hypothetical protein n=1 Tax=Campylobacter hyointestinalis TaxID=198 RepID=UPI0011ACAC27|nr:hypothetical protein [Campylobacter hyointestinalis]TWO19273.1 hypothetical protein YZ80_07795 [Campylobacter hyointestinalis]
MTYNLKNTNEPREYETWLKSKFEKSLEKTSDDTFTPPEVYEKVIEFISEKWSSFLENYEISRPFYPGGDYEKEDYTNKVVIDNPPFSIIAQIVEFYTKNDIPFFIFASMASIGTRLTNKKCSAILNKSEITYTNEITAKTHFLSNFDYLLGKEPKLYLGVDIMKRKKRAVNRYINVAKLQTHPSYYEIPTSKIKIVKKHLAFGGALNLDDEVLEVINQERIKKGLYTLINYGDKQKTLI